MTTIDGFCNQCNTKPCMCRSGIAVQPISNLVFIPHTKFVPADPEAPTLRDRFAMAALQSPHVGIIREMFCQGVKGDDAMMVRWRDRELAIKAYEMADHMIEARKR